MSPFAKSFATQNPNPSGATMVKALFQNNIFAVNILTFVGLVLLCFAYVVQVNGSISKGYQIQVLETQIQELSLKNQALDRVSQRAQSLDHVVKSVKMLGLVDAGQPEYINTAKPALAMAN